MNVNVVTVEEIKKTVIPLLISKHNFDKVLNMMMRTNLKNGETQIH